MKIGGLFTVSASSLNKKQLQWNLSYVGSVGPRGVCNFKIARNSELMHELCTYSTWLYKNTGHKYIKHKNVYKYGRRNIYESGWAFDAARSETNQPQNCLQTMIPLEMKFESHPELATND